MPAPCCPLVLHLYLSLHTLLWPHGHSSLWSTVRGVKDSGLGHGLAHSDERCMRSSPSCVPFMALTPKLVGQQPETSKLEDLRWHGWEDWPEQDVWKTPQGTQWVNPFTKHHQLQTTESWDPVRWVPSWLPWAGFLHQSWPQQAQGMGTCLRLGCPE